MCFALTMDSRINVFLIFSLNFFHFEGRTIVACPRRHQYIQVNANGTQKCVPCEPCPKGKQRKRCSLWQGSECEPCPEGSYSDKIGNKCNTCTECQPGYYIYKQCMNTEDAVCIKCPQGTYSSSVNARHCDVCIQCKAHEIQIHYCNSTSNYKCGDCMQEYYRDSATGNCLPCSKCHGNDSIVVPECYRKNQGYSDKNCLLSNTGIPFDENDTRKRISTDWREVDKSTFLLIVLSIVVLSCCVMLSAFICIYSSYNTQRCLRETRDISLRGERKHSTQSLDVDHEEKSSLTNRWIKRFCGILRSLWETEKDDQSKSGRHHVEGEHCIKNNVPLNLIDLKYCSSCDINDCKTREREQQMTDSCHYSSSWTEKYGNDVYISISDSCNSGREASCTEEAYLKDDEGCIERPSEEDSNNEMMVDSDNTARSFPQRSQRHSSRKKRKHRREPLSAIFCKQKFTNFTTYSTL